MHAEAPKAAPAVLRGSAKSLRVATNIRSNASRQVFANALSHLRPAQQHTCPWFLRQPASIVLVRTLDHADFSLRSAYVFNQGIHRKILILAALVGCLAAASTGAGLHHGRLRVTSLKLTPALRSAPVWALGLTAAVRIQERSSMAKNAADHSSPTLRSLGVNANARG